MPSYSDSFIRERAGSGGKDPGRMRYAEKLLARARAGDQAALQELGWRSGVLPDPDPSDKEGAWATADARNFGKMLFREATGGQYTPQYDEANDGSFKLGKTLGGVLKTLAPATALIPGVGIPLAAGLSAATNTAGSLLKGEGFDLMGSLQDAAMGAGGAALLGGQGFKGIGGIPGRLGLGGGGGAATQAAGAAGEAAAAGGGGGGGFLPGLARSFGLMNPDGSFNAGKALGLAGTVAGGISAHNQAKKANRVMEGAHGLATGALAQRAPVGAGANAALLRAMGGLGQPYQPTPSQATQLVNERLKRFSGPMPGSRGAPMPALSRAMM